VRFSATTASAAKALTSLVLGLGQKTRAPTARNTAEAFASLRAAGSSVRDAQVRNPDHLASRFIALGPRLTTFVKVPALRSLARRTAERVSPGAYYYELARVKHIDRVLREELDSGIEQLVILGAGFDTRAYNLPSDAKLRCFEIDAPKTKLLAGRLKDLKVDDALIVVEAFEEKLFLAARNLPAVEVLTVAQLDPVSLARHDRVLVTVGALKMLEERLA